MVHCMSPDVALRDEFGRPRLLLLSEGELTDFANREYHCSGQVRVYIVAQTCEQRRRPHGKKRSTSYSRISTAP
jgi:hypothetical protein